MEKPASTRQLKVAREIQKDLAEIIRAKGMAAFGGALVTVSEVRVSPDLSWTRTTRPSAANSATWWASSSASCRSSCSTWIRALTMRRISRNC